MVKVLVAGYGVIGQRIADGVEAQGDMELIGVVDTAPTLTVRALKDKGMPYKLFAAFGGAAKELEKADIPVAGTMEDILPEVDIILDATPGGVGAKNKSSTRNTKRKLFFRPVNRMKSLMFFFMVMRISRKELIRIT